MNQQNPIVSKYARHFFSGTLLSRISGMVRDMSMAAMFGDHPSVAAFMVAFRFSHFLRRLLSEGTMQSIFIPHYEELRLKNAPSANGFFFRLYVLLITLLLCIILAVEIPLSLNGFTVFSSEKEVVHLFAWMFPSLIFISLYGLNISLLQCRNSFFTSSVAPFACNVIWILAVFLFSKQDASKAMVNLAIFILIGFFTQWLITLPKTWKVLAEGRRNYAPPLFSIPREIRTIGKATLFGMIGVTAVQINSFLDMLFARYADLKGPIYLWYAIRLEQLPLALIGFACVYSIIPSLSRLIKAQELQQAQELFFFGYKRIFLLVVPCTFALVALGLVSVNLLFGRGHFSSFAVMQTTLCLWAYGISLLPSTLIVYQSSLFYAFGDFKTPTIASLVSVAANILLNALFVFYFHWGAISIALSTSFSSCLNYWMLKKAFLQKGYWPITHPKFSQFVKLFTISGTACLCCIGLDYFFLKIFHESPRTFAEQTMHFFGQLALFVAVFIPGLFLLDKQTLFTIKSLIFSRDKQLSTD
jgi:putative peptidoglycan lipid II flippase